MSSVPQFAPGTHVKVDYTKLADNAAVDPMPHNTELVVRYCGTDIYNPEQPECGTTVSLLNLRGGSAGLVNSGALVAVEDEDSSDGPDDTIDGPDVVPDSQDMSDPDAPEERDYLTNKEMDQALGND